MRCWTTPTAALAALLITVRVALGCGDLDEERIELLSSPADAPRCSEDTECAVPLPYCNVHAGRCVECLTDTNCGKKVCHPSTYTCQDCQSSGDCSGSNPYCAEGDCVECLASGNCPEPSETCDTVEQECVARCAEDADCTKGDRLICALPREVCVECLADSECSSDQPRCVDDRCHQCAADADCAAPDPYCRLDKHECKECQVDADCESGLRCDNYDCKE